MKKEGHNIALYRAYRPASFKDVIGQDDVVKILETTLKENTFSHAYLFSGGRGTGKTSVARIFAKELGSSPSDIYEIDAASNRGIDDIRELRDGVHVLPMESKYKVYIIDEVHMLTKEAFNALLKTLEEPPAHALFILATTEIDKVPDTIISRCQSFIFKKPSVQTLAKVIVDIAKKEGYSIDIDSAELIALVAEGSFRDALGTLEKVGNSSKDTKLSREEVEEIIGAPRSGLVRDFVKALVVGEKEKGFKVIETLRKNNAQAKLFFTMTLKLLRRLLILKSSPEMKKDIIKEIGEDEVSFLETLLSSEKVFNSQSLLKVITTWQMSDVSTDPFLPLEIMLME